MSEINRLVKKGAMDKAAREKARIRHNKSANTICLSLDKEVLDFLSLSSDQQKSIARTLRDIGMTDFGYLSQPETAD